MEIRVTGELLFNSTRNICKCGGFVIANLELLLLQTWNDIIRGMKELALESVC